MNKEAWNKLPEDLKVIVQGLIAKFTQDQHEYLVYESILAVDKFRKAGNEVYKVPADIDEALVKEADVFYEEKSKNETPIFGEIYHSMKKFGEDYNAIN